MVFFDIFSFSWFFSRTCTRVNDTWWIALWKAYMERIYYNILYFHHTLARSQLLLSTIKIAVIHGHGFYFLPNNFAINLQTWSWVFFGIPIIFPEFHHIFLETPILLNWHLNTCWPVRYSSHISKGWYPQERFLSRLLGMLAAEKLFRVTSCRAVV